MPGSPSQDFDAGLAATLRSLAGAKAIETTLRTLSRAGRWHKEGRALRKGVEVLRDLPYRPGGDPAHTLDVYRPEGVEGPLPVLLYVHGGGFRILSKDTHWMFGYGYARRGFVVFSINYRLAPAHPFPAALIDASTALSWVMEHAAEYGGDPKTLVYGGESAGGNLSLSLAIAGAWRRPEPYAEMIWDLDPRPVALIPACGMLQVSRAERYLELEEIPVWIRDRIAMVCRGYLPDPSGDSARYDLADPLRFLEEAPPPERPLPAIFAPCGTKDPVLDDTVRLGRALERFEGESRTPLYENGLHAFHAFFWSEPAKACWKDQDAFLARHIPGLRGVPDAGSAVAPAPAPAADSPADAEV